MAQGALWIEAAQCSVGRREEDGLCTQQVRYVTRVGWRTGEGRTATMTVVGSTEHVAMTPRRLSHVVQWFCCSCRVGHKAPALSLLACRTRGLQQHACTHPTRSIESILAAELEHVGPCTLAQIYTLTSKGWLYPVRTKLQPFECYKPPQEIAARCADVHYPLAMQGGLQAIVPEDQLELLVLQAESPMVAWWQACQRLGRRAVYNVLSKPRCILPYALGQEIDVLGYPQAHILLWRNR